MVHERHIVGVIRISMEQVVQSLPSFLVIRSCSFVDDINSYDETSALQLLVKLGGQLRSFVVTLSCYHYRQRTQKLVEEDKVTQKLVEEEMMMRRCSRIESSNNKNYRFLTRWTCTGFGFIFIFRKMRQ